MPPTLVALAGPSRSGKGTCATVFREEAVARGLTLMERQLSGPGKQYVASAWWPDITEEEAIKLFDRAKMGDRQEISFTWSEQDERFGEPWKRTCGERVPLQVHLQRMLQGARDRWGEGFWTDQLLPLGMMEFDPYPSWVQGFEVHDPEGPRPADIAIISDLRQVSEAKRVKDLGGLVIEMHRPEVKDSYITGGSHITEQRLSALAPDLVDGTINNMGDLDDLAGVCRTAFVEGVLPHIAKGRRS